MGEIMKRLATFALAVAIANTFAGCQHRVAHSASAVIRYRIFEAPAKLVDEVVPAENRTPPHGLGIHDYAWLPSGPERPAGWHVRRLWLTCGCLPSDLFLAQDGRHVDIHEK